MSRVLLRPLLLSLLVGCGDKDGDDTSGGGDDTAVTSTDLCADAPVVTWENFGQGFLIANCQSCHAEATESRNGAPEDITFDTYEQSIAQADRILARAAADPPTMPPLGGTLEDDRYLLEVWLTCWEDLR